MVDEVSFKDILKQILRQQKVVKLFIIVDFVTTGVIKITIFCVLK